MLHQLFFYLTCPDIVNVDKFTPENFLHKVLPPDRHTTDAVIEKNYHKFMHLCHLDRHPEIECNISQQLVAIHNLLAYPIARKIYDCRGILVVMWKDASLFCRLRKPARSVNIWMTFGTNADHLSVAFSTMRRDAFHSVGFNITTENFTKGHFIFIHFLFAFPSVGCNVATGNFTDGHFTFNHFYNFSFRSFLLFFS